MQKLHYIFRNSPQRLPRYIVAMIFLTWTSFLRPIIMEKILTWWRWVKFHIRKLETFFFQFLKPLDCRKQPTYSGQKDNPNLNKQSSKLRGRRILVNSADPVSGRKKDIFLGLFSAICGGSLSNCVAVSDSYVDGYDLPSYSINLISGYIKYLICWRIFLLQELFLELMSKTVMEDIQVKM